MTKLVIFDFDGTICDTLKDCLRQYKLALTMAGFPEPDEEQFADAFGKPSAGILRAILPEGRKTDENVETVMKNYIARYTADEKPNSVPFPGVLDLLKRLSADGYTVAVNSNKTESILTDMCEKKFPGMRFDAVVGCIPERKIKPDPEGVFELMERFGADRSTTLYVGDGINDIGTAKNAGIPIVYVTWGTGRPEYRLDPYIRSVVDTAEALEKEIRDYFA